MAEMARDACHLDEVIFMVSGNPPFKQGKRIAPGDTRLKMVQEAIKGNPAFSASDAELARDGITYTSDTLEDIRRQHPDDEVFFIMGADSLLTLSTWHQASRIAKLCKVISLSRPGYEVPQSSLDELMDMGFSFALVEAPLLDISSSEIRRRCQEGSTIRYLVPDPVRDIIIEEGLYKEGLDG